MIVDKYFLSDNCLKYDTYIYTSDGFYVLNITDKKIEDVSFTITMGNVTNTITNNNSITNTLLNIKLDSLKLNKVNHSFKNLRISNPNFGTLDL